ncbi:Predicted arabinose efflux permease, MFS family [Microbacterium enclense]|uniref:Predicted arabinose efflux permease, MFS family n=2 Tax=Microbacterium enclense TaxID=993073 RepID=A0A1G6R6H6_9MICO|nr:hypothetical protein AS029_15865 [Microbacterium enclense]SDC99685.1 Predicted arabinose efflux permease, MFS family [Microbacterium enclense]
MVVAQLLGSTVDGVAVSLAVLYFHESVGIPEVTIGLILAAGAAASLVLATPLGVIADRIGLHRMGMALSALSALALGTYALASNVPTFMAGAMCFFVAQVSLNAIRQGIVAAQADPARRIRTRAIIYTMQNAGLGLGTVVGVLVVALNLTEYAPWAFATAALVALVAGATFIGLPAAPTTPVLRAGPRLTALRDGRFMLVTGLSVILFVAMPLLSVLLPLWVSTRTASPSWLAAAGLALNTVLIVLFQTTIASRLRSDNDASRFAWIGGIANFAACVLIGSASLGTPLTSSLIVLVGIMALTAGEMFGGLAAWHLAFHHSPPELQGQYQGTFSTAYSLARIIGPGAALPLVLGTGVTGWVILGLAFAVACGGLTVIGRRPPPTIAKDS